MEFEYSNDIQNVIPIIKYMHKYISSVKLNRIMPFNDIICNEANNIEEIIIDIVLPKYILPSIYTPPLNTISSTIGA